MKKRVLLCFLVLTLLTPQGSAAAIRWVDFRVGYAALKAAMELDIASQGEEKMLDWVDILALAAV